ncbi:MAG: hypothetical protein ACRDGA_09335 [Bacteroidota bacterium]
MKKVFVLGLTTLSLFLPATGRAHHEAIFGPQSSLMLSAKRFVSLQFYSRQTGIARQRTQESTGLISFGFTPVENLPLAITMIFPYSRIQALDAGGKQSGVEDAVLGLRYRYDLDGLNRRWNSEGNFLMAMAAVEVNNGSIDHPAWQGPTDLMVGVLGSFERDEWSTIGYAYYRHHGRNVDDSRAGYNLFLGGGLAYTPFEDHNTGRLISYQLGVSYEIYGTDDFASGKDMTTGGKGLLLHPTVVYSPGQHVLFFGQVSAPVWQQYRAELDRDRFRVGVGVVYAW